MKVSKSLALVSAVESLEPRRLFAVTVPSPIADIAVRPNASNSSVELGSVFNTTNLDSVTGTVVRFPVEAGTGSARLAGNINIELFTQTPLSTQNFLNYVTSGRYDGVIFHRAIPGFVIQAGGFIAPNATAVTLDPNLQNEFTLSPRDGQGRVNTRGTLAMAKQGGNPNSATSQWFVNLADNSGNLDNQNGGFTTFGRVFSGGMALADQIAALPRTNAGGAFTDLPVAGYTSGPVLEQNLVVFRGPAVVASPRTFFTYTVASSDAQVVAASVEGGNLTLDYGTRVGTSTVTISATDLTGATVTDTFTVTVASPSLGVSFNGRNVTPGQAQPVNVGQAFVGQTATRQVLFQNTGTGPISITGVTVPTGFSLVGTAPASIAAGQQVLLEFAIDTTTAGVKEGTISIATDAVNAVNGAFAFVVRSEVGSGVTLGTGGSKSLIFTDADGTRATFTFRGAGLARFEFSGTSPAVSTVRGVSTVTGTNVTVANVAISGSRSSSGLSVSLRGGNGRIDVASVSSETLIGALAFRGVVLTDTLSLPAGVNGVTLSSVSSATVNLLQAAASSSIRSLLLGDVAGSTITVAGGARTVTFVSLTDSTLSFGGVVTHFNATTVASSTLAAGALTNIAVRNAVTGSTLTSTGVVARATVGSFASSTLRSGLNSETLEPATAADFTASSRIAQFTVSSRAPDAFTGSNLFAANLGRLRLGQLTSGGALSRISGANIAEVAGSGELRRSFSVKRITAATDIDAALVAAGVPISRLNVDILA